MASEDGGVRNVSTPALDFFAWRLRDRATGRFLAAFFAFLVFFAVFRLRFAMAQIPFKSLTGFN
jgi:hypothetical protein